MQNYVMDSDVVCYDRDVVYMSPSLSQEYMTSVMWFDEFVMHHLGLQFLEHTYHHDGAKSTYQIIDMKKFQTARLRHGF